MARKEKVWRFLPLAGSNRHQTQALLWVAFGDISVLTLSFLSCANCRRYSGNTVQFLSKEKEVLKATPFCHALSWQLRGALSILSESFGVLRVRVKIAVGILLVENIC